MLSDVANPAVAESDEPEPAHKAETCGRGHEDKPEPEEDVDLLVEQVDGQHALNSVSVNVTHLTNWEVTQGDAREAARGWPILAQD